MSFFITFSNQRAVRKFVQTYADKEHIRESRLKPLVTVRGVDNDCEVQKIFQLAEELGGKVTQSTTYAPIENIHNFSQIKIIGSLYSLFDISSPRH